MSWPETERRAPGSRWLPRLLLAALVGGGILLAVLEAKESVLLPEGSAAPAFTMERYSGGQLSLDQLRGKPVMLGFWASWCGPCLSELPELVKLAGQYQGQGLVFVAANTEDEREAVEALTSGRLPGLRPYVAFADGATSDSYRVRTLPTLYFLDPEGRVISADSGALSEGRLRRRIERALGRR